MATLLEAISETPSEAPPPRPTVPGRPPGVLPYEINEWLDKLGKAVRSDDYPADVNQRLLYRLHPSDERIAMPVLAISLLSVRTLKNGNYSDSYTQPNVADFSADRAPKYYRDSDIDIVSQLRAHGGGYSFRAPPQSADLLTKILATGRAFLARLQARAVALG